MTDLVRPAGALVATAPAYEAASTNRFGITNVGSHADPSFVDVDGDGDLDLFIGNGVGNTLFFRNSGSSSAPAYEAASTNPFGITDVGYVAIPTLSDVDGDGDLDLFIGNSAGNTLFFRNSGSTSAPAYEAASTNPFGITDVGDIATPSFADFDRDGDLDLFIGNRVGNTLFFRNSGSSSAPAYDAASTNPFGITDVGDNATPSFADIDRDGDLDLFIGNSAGNTLFFRNSGSTSAPAYEAASTNPFGITDVGTYAKPSFADVDGDGDLDLFIGNSAGYTFFFRNTAATPVAPVNATTASGTYGVGAVITLTVQFSEGLVVTGTPRLKLETGTTDQYATYSARTTTSVSNDTLTFTYTVQAGDSSADLNQFSATALELNSGTIKDAAGNDAILTLAAPGAAGSLAANAALLIDGTAPTGALVATAPAYANPTPGINLFGITDVGSHADPSFVDVDGDGDLDLFIGNSAGNTLFFRNSGSSSAPAYEAASTNPFGITNAGNYAKPSLVDVDGDGDLDLFIGNMDGTTFFFRNSGSSSAPAYVAANTNPFGITDVGNFATPSFADIDRDGDLDLFIGNSVGNTLFFRNSGNSSAPAYEAASTNPFGITDVGTYAKPSFADVDGDGDLDLFMGKEDGNTLFFRNSGSSSAPAYEAASTNPFGITDVGNFATPSFADIDRDGDLDLFIGNGVGNTLFFRNSGSSSAPAYANPTPGINPFGITNADSYAKPTLVDVDGDGDLDLFIGNLAGNTLFFRNSGSSSAPAYVAAGTNPFGITNAGPYPNLSIADVDGDGDLDLFIGNMDGNTIFFRNNATAGATAPAYEAASTNPFGITDVGNFAKPSFADVDGDGDLDLFIGNGVGNTLFFRNSGSSSAPAYEAASTNPFGIQNVGTRSSPTFADVDGDGDLDLFMGNEDGNTFFFRNSGSSSAPAYVAASTNPFGIQNVGGGEAQPSFADLNGDGNLDILITTTNGDNYFYLNTAATSVAPVNATTASGTYGVGAVITLTLQFSEGLVVTGTPRLKLETGTTDQYATYSARTTTSVSNDTLTFTYTVQAGDSSADLDQFSATALELNSGTIKDTAGNDAILTLAAPGTTGSLAANAALLIAAVDSVAPSISAVASTNSAGTYGIATLITLTVQFSEIVLVSGTPTLKLETGSTDRLASYANGSGTNTLSFTYTVQAGDISADLDQFSASALELNSGTIRDAAGNNAVLTLAAPGAAGSLAANAALVIAAVTISSPPASNGGSGNDAGDNSSPAITTVTKSVASTPTPVQEATSPTTTIAVAPIAQWAPVVSVTPTSITSTSTQESTTIAADKQFYSTISLPIAPDSTAQPEILAFQNQTFEEISKDKPLTASANAFIAQYTVPIAAGSEASTDAVSLLTNLVDFTVKVPDFQSSSEAKLDTLSVSAPVEITIKLQYGVKADAYVKINPSTGEAYDFTYDPITGIGAELIGSNNDGTVDTIKLHIIDGGKGDDDGIANGLISDPGFLALSPRSDLYRFYNAATAMHFFTDSSQERDTINNSNWGYRYEGVSDQTLLTQGQAVQRFFNSKTGEHFFTPDSKEAAAIVSHPEWGYALEGEGFKVSTIAQLGMSTPVYRFLNNSNHTHFFTSDSLEKDSIISSLPVYQYEGVAWYV